MGCSRGRFHQQPQVEDFSPLARGQRPHLEAAVGKNIDQAFRVQAHQRFAHRNLAGTEFGRRRVQSQRGAWRVGTGQYAAAHGPVGRSVRDITMESGRKSAKLVSSMESRFAVMRRGLQFCLLALSLMVLAPVTLACDSATPNSDCCHTGSPAPCDAYHGSGLAASAPWSCCAAVPAPAPASNVVSVRPRNVTTPFGTPDLLAVSTSLARIAGARPPDPAASPKTRRLALNPQPIFLLTRRLRL